MKTTQISAISFLSILVLSGCAVGDRTHHGASSGSMDMAMMGDKEMMDMCMTHMSQMSPEMRQQHMEMMQRHHQMMDQKMKPQGSS